MEKKDASRAINFHGTINGSGYTEGDTHVTFSGQQQNLAEAATEIQALLEQLSKTYPNEKPSTLARVAASNAVASPSLKARLLSAIDAGTLEAIAQALNHPAAAFFIAAIKDWNESKDVRVPNE